MPAMSREGVSGGEARALPGFPAGGEARYSIQKGLACQPRLHCKAWLANTKYSSFDHQMPHSGGDGGGAVLRRTPDLPAFTRPGVLAFRHLQPTTRYS